MHDGVNAIHSDRASDLVDGMLQSFAYPEPSIKLLDFPLLNKMTGGLRKHEFTILCGSTGSGKTTLCTGISSNLIEKRVPHFVASVETGQLDFMRRIGSWFMAEDWNRGDPIPVDDLKRFETLHYDRFMHGPLWISRYEDRFSVDTLIAEIQAHIEKHKIEVAIIDNLNFFLEVTSAQQSIQEMDRVIHNLIIYSKQAPVHIIMVMHPKKTENTRVESEFDIKGSSTAVQEAHNVFLWNRPKKDWISKDMGPYVIDDTFRELKISKMRRYGGYVGKSIMFKSINGVKYEEVGTL